MAPGEVQIPAQEDSLERDGFGKTFGNRCCYSFLCEMSGQPFGRWLFSNCTRWLTVAIFATTTQHGAMEGKTQTSETRQMYQFLEIILENGIFFNWKGQLREIWYFRCPTHHRCVVLWCGVISLPQKTAAKILGKSLTGSLPDTLIGCKGNAQSYITNIEL